MGRLVWALTGLSGMLPPASATRVYLPLARLVPTAGFGRQLALHAQAVYPGPIVSPCLLRPTRPNTKSTNFLPNRTPSFNVQRPSLTAPNTALEERTPSLMVHVPIASLNVHRSTSKVDGRWSEGNVHGTERKARWSIHEVHGWRRGARWRAGVPVWRSGMNDVLSRGIAFVGLGRGGIAIPAGTAFDPERSSAM